MAAVVSLAAAPRLFERVWIRKSLPADPLAIAAYLADRSAQGAAAATVRTIRAAIRAGHVDTGADDPTGHDGVRRVLQGLTRQAAGRGRGQTDPLTADDCAAILATASLPRRTGRGMESEADAADRGATDRAIVAVLFQGGLRRSEAAALRWADVQDAADGRGIVVYVRQSKTDQDGTAADVRYLKNGCAAALRQLRDRLTVQRSGLRPDGTAQVLGGINGQSIARRLTAAASAAGIEAFDRVSAKYLTSSLDGSIFISLHGNAPRSTDTRRSACPFRPAAHR